MALDFLTEEWIYQKNSQQLTALLYEGLMECLEEAIEAIRLLWKGGVQSYRGKHYTIDNAQLFTLPPEAPPIAVAAAAALARGRVSRRATM